MNWLNQLGNLMGAETPHSEIGAASIEKGEALEKTSGATSPMGDTPALTPERRQELRDELLAINARWEKGLEVERQGWRSPEHEAKALDAFTEMAARSNAIRDELGPEPWWWGPAGEVADVPDVSQLGDDVGTEYEENPLLAHLVKAGGYAGLGERFDWTVAKELHDQAIAWQTESPDGRKRLGEQYKAVFSRAKAAEAARKEKP